MLSSLNAVISTNESTRIIAGHSIFNLAYPYKFQLKTTHQVIIPIEANLGIWQYFHPQGDSEYKPYSRQEGGARFTALNCRL